jgi:transcriptional regulator GlxA family with amidase domain
VRADSSPPLTHFGFLTLRRFSLIAFTNAVETLRMANYLARESLYRWSVYSLDGAAVEASNGLTVAPTSSLSEAELPQILLVCGGADMPSAVDERLIELLQRLGRRQLVLGSLCTGAYALARAGLLDGYRCAIHWENLWELSEAFPRVVFSPDLFVIDRDRCTCTGGIAPLELILHLITPRIGRTLAAGISEQFILERIRDNKDRQRIPLLAQIGGAHSSIAQAVTLMEANIEEPLPLEELARMTEISQRQLQRVFQRSFGLTPAQYYVGLRLRRARELLQQTALPITSIALSCGFRSPCHFSKSFRAAFGNSPSRERRPPAEPHPAAAPPRSRRQGSSA